MANTEDGRSQNQPSHEAQVKGGQHSHQGNSGGPEGSKGSETSEGDGRSENRPSHEASVKGGESSHNGSRK